MELESEIDIALLNEKTVNDWRNKFDSEKWKQLNKLSIAIGHGSLGRNQNCGCIPDFFSYLKSLKKE